MRVGTDLSSAVGWRAMKWLVPVLAVVAGVVIAVVGLLVTAPKPNPRKPVAVADRAAELRAEVLPAPFAALVPHATPKTPPQEGDWLDAHPEDGQSLAELSKSSVSAKGRVIYLVPVGTLDAPHAAVLDALEPLVAAWFQLEVKRLPAIDEALAKKGEREGQLGRQWYTGTILELLRERRPDDAAAVMAITQVDLYPDPSWNFVYGEASYEERIGVSSLARDGDPSSEKTLVLRRSLGTSVHEVGHMLGLAHCIAWECVMNGSNHRAEADSRPLEPCPVCQAKLRHVIGFDARARWEALARAYADAGLEDGARAAEDALRWTAPDAGP